MRRTPHGGTRRPPLVRPGNGYGRPLRPGPISRAAEPTGADFQRALARWAVDVDLVHAERDS